MTAEDALECLDFLQEYGLVTRRTVQMYVMNLVGADQETELGRSVYRSVMDALLADVSRYARWIWEQLVRGRGDRVREGADDLSPCPPGEQWVSRSEVERLREALKTKQEQEEAAGSWGALAGSSASIHGLEAAISDPASWRCGHDMGLGYAGKRADQVGGGYG